MTELGPPLSTDTPIAPKTFPPPSTADVIKATIGDLARPFVLYMVGLSIFIVPMILVCRIDATNIELVAGAAFVAALGGTAGGLYWGKAWEVAKGRQADADVQKSAAGTTS